MITISYVFEVSYKDNNDQLFFMSTRSRARNNQLTLQQGRFRRDIKKDFLTVSTVKHWEQFCLGRLWNPHDRVGVNNKLEKHVLGMVWVLLGLASGREGVECMSNQGAFQPCTNLIARFGTGKEFVPRSYGQDPERIFS